MAQLTLGDVLNFVKDYIPDIPQAKVVRKLNLILEDIHDEVSQIEMSTFTTRAKVTTGTVSATAASTAVTFSSAVLTYPNTDSLIFCRISGDNTWYTVTPSSTTAGALSSSFAGTTGATLAYTIVYPVIVFPAAVSQVISAQQAGYKALEYASRENASLRSEAEIVGRPLWYGPYIPDTTATPDDAHRIILTPFPDIAYSYNYSYVRRPTLLGITDATSTKLTLPSVFNRSINFGTLALCWSQQDGEDRFGPWWGRYRAELEKARAHTSTEIRPRVKTARESRRHMTYAVQYPPSP